MPFQIIRNDITKVKVDAIVNAANPQLKMGGGVCGAIFQAAGIEALQKECDSIGACKVGEAVITGGYALPAKHIIHTAGPIWQGGTMGEERLLHDCYINSLQLALKNGCKSVAFPLISSGVYGYPKDKALRTAIAAIGEFLLAHEMMVYLVVYDKNAYVLSEKLFASIEKFIDDRYVEEQLDKEIVSNEEMHWQRKRASLAKAGMMAPCAALPDAKLKRSLKDVLGQLDETFSQTLLRLIDEKGLTDVETYKRANIDRKLFSKIRSDKDYNPSKMTAIAFAIALRLSLDETKDLLARAGYTLSPCSKFDLIIEFFIREGNYNIFQINEALFAFDQILLGA